MSGQVTLAHLVAWFPSWIVRLNLAGYHAHRGTVYLRAATAQELADKIRAEEGCP